MKRDFGRGLTRVIWALYAIAFVSGLILSANKGVRMVMAEAIFMVFIGIILLALIKLGSWVAKGFRHGD